MSHRAYLYNISTPSQSQSDDIMMMEWGYEVPLLFQPLLVSDAFIAENNYNNFIEDANAGLFYSAADGIENIKRFYEFLGKHTDVLVNDAERFVNAKNRIFDYLETLKHRWLHLDMWDVFNMNDTSHSEQAQQQKEIIVHNNAIITEAINSDDPMVLQQAAWLDINPGFKNFTELLNHSVYDYGNEIIFQSYDEQNNAEYFEENGKWGLKDNEGAVLLPPQFDEAYAFDEMGLSVVVKQGKFGYVNTSGEIVIPLVYDDAYDFGYSEVAMVKKDNKMALIDKGNKPVTDFIYDDITTLDDGTLYNAQKDGSWGVINAEGEEKLSFILENKMEDGFGFYFSTVTGTANKKIYTLSFDYVGSYPKEAVTVIDDNYLHIKPYKNSKDNMLFAGANNILTGFDKINMQTSFPNLLILRKGKYYAALGKAQQALLLPFEYYSLIDKNIYLEGGIANFVFAKKGQLTGVFNGLMENPEWLFPLNNYEGLKHLYQKYFAFKQDGEWQIALSEYEIVFEERFTDVFVKPYYPGFAYAFIDDDLYIIDNDQLLIPGVENIEEDLEDNTQYQVFDQQAIQKLKQWLANNS